MDLSYLSAFVFLFTTYLYYFRGKLTLDIPNDNDTSTGFIGGEEGDSATYENYSSYASASITRSALYFLLVVVVQCGFNISTIINKCGGTVGKNILISFMMTMVPWTLIFGGMMGLLIVYPGLKGAFGDVIGYFTIAREANDILSTLLADSKAVFEATPDEKKRETSVLLTKVYGDKGVLINTMNPENFHTIWAVLKPTFQKNILNDKDALFEKKQHLFSLVMRKDNIGESLWYIYTGILLMVVVSYNMSIRGCDKDLEKMKEEQADYKKKSDEINKQKDKTAGKTYAT
jgi:hypothetical protein